MLREQSLSQHDYQRILIEIKLHEELFALVQAESKTKIYAPFEWAYGLVFFGSIPLLLFYQDPKLIIAVLAGIFLALTPPALRGYFRLRKAKRNFENDEWRIRATENKLDLRFDSKHEIFYRDKGSWPDNERLYFDPFLNRCWQDSEPNLLKYDDLKHRYDEEGDLIADEHRYWKIGSLVDGMSSVMNGNHLDFELFSKLAAERYRNRRTDSILSK